MARSGALQLLLVAVLLVAAAQVARALTCGQVVSNLESCISYVEGKGPLPASCCNGVKTLNAAAKTTADRQTACTCLKSAVSSIKGFQPNLASGLPGKCGVSIPYPISTSVDCSKVK